MQTPVSAPRPQTVPRPPLTASGGSSAAGYAFRVQPADTGDTLSYDPLLLEQDPYPIYRQLRAEAPVYEGQTNGIRFWALTRFEDVQAAAREWKTFSSAEGNDLDDTGMLFGPAPAMDLCDPPAHTRMRTVLRHEFTPRAVRENIEPLVRSKVRALVDVLRERDTVDFAYDLAYPLPMAMICDWLGLPAGDQEQIRRWHGDMLDRVHGRVELPQHAIRARDEMWGYLEEAVADRRARDRDDLLSVLVRALAADRLTHDEVLANTLFLFDAGIVSTSALISSSLLHLRRFEDQRQLVRRSPELIPGAIEELLRFDAPFQWFTRVTTHDTEVRRVPIPEGARVVLVWASANRDERRWEHADRIVVTRPHRRHLSFSEGIHHCLGAPIARMEVRILFEELMPLLADYEFTEPPKRRITPSERTIVNLPARVQWTT